jgi:hypothetical protein
MVRGLSFEEVFVGAGKAQLTNIQNLPKCGFRTSDKPSFVADTAIKTGKSQRAIEKERARRRMSEAAKTQWQGKEIFPYPQKGQTRDKVAKAIGIGSGRTYDKAAKVWNATAETAPARKPYTERIALYRQG